MKSTRGKIFGIGLSKTGTTSLAKALELLGYRTRDYLGIGRFVPGDLSSVDLREIERNDAFTDTPIPSFYRELDERYPESKFILTVRDMDSWLKSCRKQFTRRLAEKENEANKQVLIDLYGCVVFEEEKFRQGYERFVQGVEQHFRRREQDLLVIDVCAGDGWDKLCSFLGQPIPDVPFPKRNVTAVQWINVEKVVYVAEEAGRAIAEIYEQGRDGEVKGGRGRRGKGVVARSLKRLRDAYDRTARRAYKDEKNAVRRAYKASEKTIVDGLKRLNSKIPVLSDKNKGVTYTERRAWGYMWLVDPLDGEEGFVDRSGEFSVNIALVESGEPILGVVCVPGRDICYYARGGAGSYKREGSGQPKRLGVRNGEAEAKGTCQGRSQQNTFEEQPEPTASLGKGYESVSGGTALNMCLVAEGRARCYRKIGPTMEWETAAAHAVAKFAGKRVYDCKSKQELCYNKKNLEIDSFVVE